MAFKVGKGSTDEMADINVTPLVDVMLVLLIIFMITTPLFQRGIDVSLPRTESSNTRGEERMIVTIVPKKTFVYFNDQPINKQLLENSLKQIYRNRKDKTIYLFADKSVPYGEVMAIMDSIKKSGIDTVGLATEPTHKE